MDTTPFSNRCEILSQIWMENRNSENLSDFIEYNDIGLPMAHYIAEKLVEPTAQGRIYIDETFELLLQVLGIPDDLYDDFGHMMQVFEDKEED